MVKFKMSPALEVFTTLSWKYEGRNLRAFPFRRIKASTLLLLVLAATLMALSYLPWVKAEAKIISMTPKSGNVGVTVNLKANITSLNGAYELWFDGSVLKIGNASGYDVNASYIVPAATAGNRTVMIVDVATGENATDIFTVLTSYTLKVDVPRSPQQLQEGDPASVSVSINGGESSATYLANVTVRAPSNASYTRLLNITTSNDGNGTVSMIYPNDFPTGASTNFTGMYEATFNTTLAAETFFVGLTNSSEYHRFQTVDIKAVYAPNENVTVAIVGKRIYASENVTADDAGVVRYTNWVVPSDAPIDNYTASVTSTSNITSKVSRDVQNFSIPGYAVNITALNLAGETVPSVTLEVFEKGESVTSGLSGSNGIAPLMLEFGNYTHEAFFKDVKVGGDTLSIVGETSLNTSCSLTNLRITVTDEAQLSLPEVKLFLIPDNKTLTTAINGTAVAHSLLPNVTYTVNASRYGTLFNSTTIQMLPATAWYDLPLACPTLTLKVSVINANGQPINDATVKAQDLMGGLYYQGVTVGGMVTLNCTLGRYSVGVYVNGVKVNETIVNLNDTTINLPINCGLYGLTVSVRVIDYFGQSIPDVGVTLQRSGSRESAVAGGDGLVAFSNVMGGELQVAVNLPGQSESCAVATVVVGNSTTVEVRIEKYVMLAGLLIETSHLLVIVAIVVIVVLLLCLEIFRRRRLKKPEIES